MSFLRGLSDPSAKAWVSSEPIVEAYLQHIMMGRMIKENDSLEPVIAAATNLENGSTNMPMHVPTAVVYTFICCVAECVRFSKTKQLS